MKNSLDSLRVATWAVRAANVKSGPLSELTLAEITAIALGGDFLLCVGMGIKVEEVIGIGNESGGF